jgi:IclR family KDG regulon transcriptional repressor
VKEELSVEVEGIGPAAEKPERRVRAVVHAASVLRIIAAAPRPLRAGQLANKAGLSKTSVFHLLRTLEAERFIARDEFGCYRLSWGLYELGSLVSEKVDLTRVVRHHLDRLCQAAGEAVLLAVLEGESVLYLDRGESDLAITMIATAGRRAPLHTNASGKLLLAFQSDEFIEKVLNRGLERRTSNTICEPTALRAQLQSVRSSELAECWQEQEIGLNSFAVPLRDYTGDVCAALTLVCPAQRMSKRELPKLASLMKEHAAAASAELGAPAVIP